MLAVGLLAAPGLAAPPASAHTTLVSTDPADGAALDIGPDRVTATFNEDLQPTFAAMTVVGPDGNRWSSDDAAVQGVTAGVGMRPLGPAGRYTVNYRVTSADGHVVSGSWSFTLTTAGPGAPGPAVSTPDRSDRIALWPLVAGAAVLIAGAALWGLRRRS